MKHSDTNFQVVRQDDPAAHSSTPTPIFEYLISKPTWKSGARGLLEAVKRFGLPEARRKAMESKALNPRNQHLWFVKGTFDPAMPDEPVIKTLASIMKWWSTNPFTLGDMAVLTDKALRDRRFPFLPDEWNTVFPDAGMFSSELVRAGLPDELVAADGSPLHLVAGVIPLTYYLRNRTDLPVEMRVRHTMEEAEALDDRILAPMILDEAFSVQKLEALARKPRTLRVLSPSRSDGGDKNGVDLARVTSILEEKAPEIIRAGGRLMFTTAELYEICRRKGFLSLPELAPRERHRIVGTAMGTRGLRALFVRYNGGQWFLPSVSMTEQARKAYLALDFYDKVGLYHFLFQSLIEEIRFIEYPGVQPIRLDRQFWVDLVNAGFAIAGKSFAEFMRSGEDGTEFRRDYRHLSFRQVLEPGVSTQLQEGPMRRKKANTLPLESGQVLDHTEGDGSSDSSGEPSCCEVRSVLEFLAARNSHPVLDFNPPYKLEDAD